MLTFLFWFVVGCFLVVIGVSVFAVIAAVIIKEGVDEFASWFNPSFKDRD